MKNKQHDIFLAWIEMNGSRTSGFRVASTASIGRPASIFSSSSALHAEFRSLFPARTGSGFHRDIIGLIVVLGNDGPRQHDFRNRRLLSEPPDRDPGGA